jgi:hypothetical protein
VVDLIIVI